MKYYKILNAEQIHNGYKFIDGLNIDPVKFNDDPRESCVAGGFYFTTKEYVHRYIEYGINIYEIVLPIDNVNFKMILDPSKNKWRANMINIDLTVSLSIFDIKTMEEFELYKHPKFIDLVSENGYYHILERCIHVHREHFIYTSNSINQASLNTHYGVLEWWKEKSIKEGIILKYTESSIDCASDMGDCNILNWWKTSGLELRYSDYTLDCASQFNHINILDWWKSSGLELKYSNYAIDYASNYGHINVLNWWKTSGLELRYSFRTIDWASQEGCLNVLDWWKSSGLELKYSDYAVDNADDATLEWWKKSGLDLYPIKLLEINKTIRDQ